MNNINKNNWKIKDQQKQNIFLYSIHRQGKKDILQTKRHFITNC